MRGEPKACAGSFQRNEGAWDCEILELKKGQDNRITFWL